MGLTELQARQDRLHTKVVLGDIENVQFCKYLATHPRLYDGCELDTGTVDFLNNYFWEYEVNPLHFEHHYIAALKQYSAQYNNLKQIEFNEKVFDIVTDKYVRQLVTTATASLARTGGKNATTSNTGTIKDDKSSTAKQEGKTTYGKTETDSITKAYETDTSGSDTVNNTDSNKQAQKNLPMQTGSTDPKQDLDWTQGASGISESNNTTKGTTEKDYHEETTETDTHNVKAGGSDSNESSVTGTDTNTRTLATEIAYEDQQTLNDLNNNSGQDDETLEITQGLGADLIKKMWNYLAAPKSLDFLTDKLRSCFILCY